MLFVFHRCFLFNFSSIIKSLNLFQHNTKKHYFIKNITLWLFALLICWQVNAQTCSQTFTATGQDDDPTVLTINAADKLVMELIH